MWSAWRASTQHYQLPSHLRMAWAARKRAVEGEYSSFVGDKLDSCGLTCLHCLTDSVGIYGETVIHLVSIVENNVNCVPLQDYDRLRVEFVVTHASYVWQRDHVDGACPSLRF